MSLRFRPLLALLLALLAGGCALLPAGGGPYSARQPLPSDTLVVRGRLWNGLTYYVRRNAEPPGRAELRLVVNAGSILEDDDQRGLAHFVEHMAFNGTEEFAQHELVDWLESVGMRFGPDVNAYTSFDETVYMLTLPTDTPGVLDTGLQILEEWAGGIVFDTAEVRKERGVVLEEWRLGRGAAARMQDEHLPVLFRRSRYAQRLPIGDPETLRTFDPRALRRFYDDWYRPDLMAVVAVGDFDPAQVEEMIRERFRWLLPRPDGRMRRSWDLPRRRDTRFAIATDPEATSAAVTLVHTLPARRRSTVGDYRRGLAETLYSGMLSDRMNERTQHPGAPFLGVSSFSGSLIRPTTAHMLSAEVGEAGVERGLAGMLEEVERVARYGFTEAELRREKADLLRAWETIAAESPNVPSGQYAGQYAGHYLHGGPILTAAMEYELHRALLPRITLEEVEERARAWLRNPDRTVLVSAPRKPGVEVPGAERLAAVMDSVAGSPVAAYREAVSDAPLVADPPQPGRVVAERQVPAAGVTEWTLSNGVRVVLRPTSFREDEILLAGRSPGGSSLVSDDDVVAAVTATAAAQVGGVGELSVVDLQKRLSGKLASVGTDLSELHEGVSGFAAPRDAATMFQLVYLYFTAPRRDSVAWEAYRQRAREMVRNRHASPEAAFFDTLTRVLSGGDPRSRPLPPEAFAEADLDRALAVYRDRFADAGDFTFYLVGSFSPDSIRPLVERWLGGLPSSGREERWRDRGYRPPDGVVRRTVTRGMEPKARTQLVFTGPLAFEREALRDLRALSEVLQIRLRERLREDLGGTYGVGVAASGQRDPYPSYRFAIEFGTSPERLPELTRVVFDELERIKRDGPTAEEVQKVAEQERRQRETDQRDNNWWATQLIAHDRYGWPLEAIAAPALRPPTADAVRAAARRFLDPARYVQVSLLPEDGAESGAVAERQP